MKIGIIGASGVVGKELLNILLANEYYDLKICASEASIGKYLLFDINDTPASFVFEKLEESFFVGLDVSFFCTDNDLSKEWIPIALKYNVYVIDNSSHFRMEESVPLIIPEINGHLVSSSKLIANPNCCTSILCMVLHPLTKVNTIKRIDISTYQAVSGAGKLGTEELELQCMQFAHEKNIEKECELLKKCISSPPYEHASKKPIKIQNHTGIFKSQIFDNCFSHNTMIDPKTGYNAEELKIINETKKIMNYDIEVSATCIRVPIMRAHSESVKIVFTNKTSEDEIRKILNKSDGIKVVDNRDENKFPEPVLATHENDILVGRIRKDYYDDTNTVFHMFICGDQLLKGAALNAYQIFKKYEDYLKLRETIQILENKIKFIKQYVKEYNSIFDFLTNKEKMILWFDNNMYMKINESYDYLMDMKLCDFSSAGIKRLEQVHKNNIMKYEKFIL